jgi:hypothetical protein
VFSFDKQLARHGVSVPSRPDGKRPFSCFEFRSLRRHPADRAHHVPSTPKPNIGVNYIWRWIPPSCLYNEHSLPNYAFGILDLTVAVTTGFITSPSALFNYEPPNELISAFPLVLIPVYLVPLSILLHLASLKKLRRETAHTSIVATASARTSSAPQMFVVSS